MEHIRIAVLDQNDNVLSFLDNEAEEATHYYDDELHEYLKGAASTFFFTSLSNTEVSNSLVVGNKLAFVYNGRDYYLNIMRAERDETEVFVEAYSLSFELLNEQIGEYKSPSAMSFSQYLETIDPEKTLLLGLNEVSDKKISYEWTGESTLLARLFSLATVFSAEIEFVTNLNENYSLKNITLNVYKEHSDDYQGIGKNQTGYMLRYGVDISGIRKKSDATDVYTSIRLTGKDGLSIAELDKTEYDSKGNIEYRSPKGDPCIRAVQARDRFPSNLMNKNDRYIARYATYDTDNVNVLYGQALGMLKKNSIPQVEYEVDGYADTGIGDTVSIEDSEYKPTLYLEARVSEQVRSFTNSSKNKTIFSNFQEKQSQVSAELLAQMQAMINTNKIYAYSIISSNGVVFKNNIGETTLEASVMDGGKDVTDSLSIVWYKNGLRLSNGKSVVIQANTIIEKAVLRFEAYGTDEKMRGFYEITIMNVDDGKGVTSIDVEYCQSTSPTNPPSGSWLTTAPVWENGKYIWTRTITRYSVGPSVTTNPVCVTGEQGDYGVSATAIQEQYYLSSSSTMQSGGIWGDICPEWVKGKYIWTRSKCSWSNGSTTYTSPVLAQGINTANSNANSAQNTANNAQNTAENANDTANSAQEIANAASVKAANLEANVAKLDTALIGKADIDLANIKNGCITTAMIGTGVIGTTQIANGSITDAKIVGLTANKITAGRLDAAQIEVVNLNAANITVGTINGVQIAPGAIDLDKLSGTVSGMINVAVDTANNAQITADGKNKIYYQNAQPGLTGNKKGDTWFDTANGYRAYVWNGTAWSLSPFGSAAIADDAVTLAKVGADLQSFMDGINDKALAAQTSADGKNTVFYQDTQPPTTGRKTGDTWYNTAKDNAISKWDGGKWTEITFGAGAISDSIISAEKLSTDIANKLNTAASDAATAKATADTAKANASAAQTAANAAKDAAAAADILAKAAQTSANSAQTTADGKNTVFYTTTAPPVTGRKTNDIWFDTANGNRMYYWNGSAWTLRQFGTNALANLSITNALIANAAIDNAKIANLDAGKITTGIISADRIGAGSLTVGKLTEAALIEIQKPAVDAKAAADAAASAAATAQGTANTAKTNAATAQSAADAAKATLAAWCYNNNLTYIDGGDIYTGTVTAAKIAAGAITTEKLAANAVTAAKITAGTITGDKIAGKTISADKIVAGTITANSGVIANGAILSAMIGDAQIGTAKIANLAVTGAKIANATITNAQIADATIQSAKIAALDAAKITTGILSADRIAAGSIVFGKLDGSTQGTINTAKDNANAALLLEQVETITGSLKKFKNVCGYTNDAPNVKGYLIITTPITPSRMVNLHISGYNYVSANETIDLRVGFYDYGSSITSAGYVNNGSLQFSSIKAAKVSASDTRAVIIIGSADTVWQYPKIIVDEVITGYGTVCPDSYKDGFSATITATLPTTYVQTATLSGSAFKNEIGSLDSVLAAWCYNNNKTYINGGKIYTGTVTATQIAANAIVAGKIAANAVTTATIAAGAINADKLSANSVIAGKIAANAVTVGTIAAGSVNADKLASKAVIAAKIAANAVTSDKIIADAITTAKIAASAVTANEIAAGAVTAAKISAGQITADKIAAGAITADKFYGTAITSKNYLANSAGMKINLANGTIDTKNFKVDSAGNVAMTGTLTMQGAQTMTVRNASATRVGYMAFKAVTDQPWSPGALSVYGDGLLHMAAGDASSSKAFLDGYAGGTQLFELAKEGSNLGASIGLKNSFGLYTTNVGTAKNTLSGFTQINGDLDVAGLRFFKAGAGDWIMRCNGVFHFCTSNYGMYVNNYDNSGWVPVYAATFYTQSSEKYKNNILEYSGLDALAAIKKSKIYGYQLKDSPGKQHVGFITERQLPKEAIGENGESVDIYSMAGINWRATQEIVKQYELLQKQLLEQKQELALLRAKIGESEMLEGRSRTISLVEYSKIGDDRVCQFYANINSETPETMDSGRSIYNQAVYKTNRVAVMKDQADFETYAYSVQDAMIAEKNNNREVTE